MQCLCETLKLNHHTVSLLSCSLFIKFAWHARAKWHKFRRINSNLKFLRNIMFLIIIFYYLLTPAANYRVSNMD